MSSAALSAAELVGIYNGTYPHWNDLPGNSGGSTDAIIPLIPQTSSGVRTIFLNALKAANGGTAITLGPRLLAFLDRPCHAGDLFADGGARLLSAARPDEVPRLRRPRAGSSFGT